MHQHYNKFQANLRGSYHQICSNFLASFGQNKFHIIVTFWVLLFYKYIYFILVFFYSFFLLASCVAKKKKNTNWLRIGASYPHEKDPSSTRTAADVESSSLYISFILRTFAEQIVFTSLFDGETRNPVMLVVR